VKPISGKPEIGENASNATKPERNNFGGEVVKLLRMLLPMSLLAAGAYPAEARSLRIAGAAGYLAEWELDAEVTAAISGGREEFSGPLTLKHVGLCSANGPEEKSGKIEFYISRSVWSSEIHATLFINGARCSYRGTLSGSSGGFMDCSDGSGIPLTLLVK
jgi:hypothetical protein